MWTDIELNELSCWFVPVHPKPCSHVRWCPGASRTEAHSLQWWISHSGHHMLRHSGHP